MKRKYKVILAVVIEGKTYRYGDVVELDKETALDYAVALHPINGKD
jgi:hypothetical protein